MPTYSYKCPKCDHIREDDARMTTFREHHPDCTECKTPCDYIWVPSVPQIAMKDGPSGIAPSKALRFKDYRRKQDEKMQKRQKDRYGHLRRDAIPNYNGQETGTWAEAQFQALKDKGAESAATFVPKVTAEKAADTKIKI